MPVAHQAGNECGIERLARLVTRDSMVGVQKLSGPGGRE